MDFVLGKQDSYLAQRCIWLTSEHSGVHQVTDKLCHNNILQLLDFIHFFVPLDAIPDLRLDVRFVFILELFITMG